MVGIRCDDRNPIVSIGLDDPIEIPTVDATGNDSPAVAVEQRTDGVASIQSIADFQFPAVWNDENVFEAIPFGQNEQSVPVKIGAELPDGGERQTIFFGWLKKIGSGGRGRLLRARAVDYASMLDTIPFEKTYRTDTDTDSEDFTIDANEVVRDVLKELNDRDSIPVATADDVSGAVLSSQEAEADDGPESGFGIQADVSGEYEKQFTSSEKSFQRTEHTLADALNWVAKQLNTEWYLRGREDEFFGNNELRIAFEQPTFGGYVEQSVLTERGDGIEDAIGGFEPSGDVSLDDNEVRVRTNQALYEIDPINAVTVVGKLVSSLTSEREGYAIGRAVHEELLARADGDLNEKVIQTTDPAPTFAANRAVSELVNELSGANEGEIVLDGEPSLTPYCTLTSYPICNDLIQTNIPPLTFETKRVEHVFPATERYATKASVGISTDRSRIRTEGGFGTGKGDIEIDFEEGV